MICGLVIWMRDRNKTKVNQIAFLEKVPSKEKSSILFLDGFDSHSVWRYFDEAGHGDSCRKLVKHGVCRIKTDSIKLLAPEVRIIVQTDTAYFLLGAICAHLRAFCQTHTAKLLNLLQQRISSNNVSSPLQYIKEITAVMREQLFLLISCRSLYMGRPHKLLTIGAKTLKQMLGW